MIDPVSVGALAEILGGLSAGIAGLDLAMSWDQNKIIEDDDVGFGWANVTGDKPAISGKTSNTVVDSTESDPLQAVEEYESAGGVVDSTTGGFIYGSNVTNTQISLKENDDGSVEAVSPAGVDTDKAIVAIAKVLGVAMDTNLVSPELRNKFAQALVTAGLVYEGGKKVKSWIDAAGNILFPKSAVDAIDAVLTEEAIGDGDYSSTGNTDIENYYSDVKPITAAFKNNFLSSRPGRYYLVSTEPAVYGMYFENLANSGLPWLLQFSTESFLYGTAAGASIPEPETPLNRASLLTFNINGNQYDIYENGISLAAGYDTFDAPLFTFDNITSAVHSALNFLYGDISSFGYPDGMEASNAKSYTSSTVPTSGGIATSPTTTTPVVAINVPGTSSIGDTTDPISYTDEDERSDALPAPLPVPIPDTNVSNPDVPLVDVSVVDSTLVDELVAELAGTLDPQPPLSSGLIPFPDMPGGQSGFPSIVPASGPGLIHVYNPTPGEMVSFGNWLWVTYADATIDKIWNNPFDGIIGAHELYATPATSGSDNIRSGFLTCPTTAALVRQRYTEIDCGTVVVPEFYGNYLDYSPYSQAYIYLPFIGINEVSVDDIAGHAVNIRYRIDAYTGSTIAMVYVAKSGYRNLCYQFAGNCAVEVPLAGGSQAAIKAGMLQAEAYGKWGLVGSAVGTLTSVASGLLTGGLPGGVAGAFGGLGSMANAATHGQGMMEAARVANKSSVQHSGSFGASHGAMGLKKPFIMIRNPIQVKVVNYNKDYGFPAHKRVIIGGCTGYLRVREVNVISAHATDQEKIAIEQALKNGVYVS